MSWDQDYHVESVEHLLERLTGVTALQLLEQEAYLQGFRIVKMEDVTLDEDIYQGDVQGKKIYFGDGRVFIPKLTERYTSNGNYGCDNYHYVLESENPEVKHIDGSEEYNPEKDELEATGEINNNGC